MRKSKEMQEKQKEQDAQLLIDRDALVQTVSHNLKKLFDSQPGSKAVIARACGITPANISRWISEKNPIMPQVEYLACIANYFDVTVDWILTNSNLDVEDIEPTYNSAFLSLLSLLYHQVIDIDDIRNPILKYLCTRYTNLEASSISREHLSDWLSYIIKEFNTPIVMEPDEERIAYILENKNNVQALNEDETYRNLAQVFTDVDLIQFVDQEILNEKKSIEYRKEQEKNAPINYDYYKYDPDNPDQINPGTPPEPLSEEEVEEIEKEIIDNFTALMRSKLQQ